MAISNDAAISIQSRSRSTVTRIRFIFSLCGSAGSAASLAQGEQEFGGGDKLAGVAQGVVRTMDQEAADGGGKAFASYASGLLHVCMGERADTEGGFFAGHGELLKEGFPAGTGFELDIEGGHLRDVELVAFRIGEQAIEAAANVADVKCGGREAKGLCVQLLGGEVNAPALGVFLGDFDGVEDGAWNGGDIGKGAAKPWLEFTVWGWRGWGVRHAEFSMNRAAMAPFGKA
jgi:hypothetical protein